MRIALAFMTLSAMLAAQIPAASGPVAIIPLPTTIMPAHGDFVLTASTIIVADPAVAAQGRQHADLLNAPTGFDHAVRAGGSPSAGGTRTGPGGCSRPRASAPTEPTT